MRYYETHIQKASLHEYIRICYPRRVSPVIFWLAMRLGLVRPRPPISPRKQWDLEAPLTLADCEEPFRSKLTEVSQQAEACGFIEPVVYRHFAMGFNNMEIASGCLLTRHAQGNFILQAVHLAPRRQKDTKYLMVRSFLTDGRMLVTSNSRPTFDPTPGTEGMFLPGAPLTELVAAHEEILRSSTAPLVSIRNNADVTRELEQLTERFFAHMTARGILREVPGPT